MAKRIKKDQFKLNTWDWQTLIIVDKVDGKPLIKPIIIEGNQKGKYLNLRPKGWSRTWQYPVPSESNLKEGLSQKDAQKDLVDLIRDWALAQAAVLAKSLIQ